MKSPVKSSVASHLNLVHMVALLMAVAIFFVAVELNVQKTSIYGNTDPRKELYALGIFAMIATLLVAFRALAKKQFIGVVALALFAYEVRVFSSLYPEMPK